MEERAADMAALARENLMRMDVNTTPRIVLVMTSLELMEERAVDMAVLARENPTRMDVNTMPRIVLVMSTAASSAKMTSLEIIMEARAEDILARATNMTPNSVATDSLDITRALDILRARKALMMLDTSWPKRLVSSPWNDRVMSMVAS